MAQRKPQVDSRSIIPAQQVSGELLDPESRVKGILERLFSDLKPNTLRAYQHSWDVLADYLRLPSRVAAAAHIVKLSAGEANALAMQWLSDLRKEGKKAATIAGRLAALKGITKRLRIVGLVTWTIETKAPKVTRYKDTSGPGSQAIVLVLEKLRERTDLKALRDVAIIHSLYTTGLRRGELAAIQLDHLEFEKSRVWITGKGRDDEETVPLQEKTKLALEAWLKVRPGTSNHVFVSLDPNSLGQPLTGNGIWKITTSYGLGRPHGIRHTAITTVLDRTKGDIRTTQEFSRHKDPRTLMRYDDNRKNLAGEASKLLEEGL